MSLERQQLAFRESRYYVPFLSGVYSAFCHQCVYRVSGGALESSCWGPEGGRFVESQFGLDRFEFQPSSGQNLWRKDSIVAVLWTAPPFPLNGGREIF